MKRKKRIKKRKVNKPLLIVSLVAVVIIIITVASFISQQRGFQEKTAEEYFEILDPTVDYGELIQNDTAVKIYTISFKIKAVGGDAHDVMVQSWARAERYPVGTIFEGEVKAVIQMMSPPPFAYLSEKNEDGKFPMEVKITSIEANGFVTIYF